jgi:hypothetical protein
MPLLLSKSKLTGLLWFLTQPNFKTFDQVQGKLKLLKGSHFCKYNNDRDTLFWGSYSLSFICGHIGLCAFNYSSWPILHYVLPLSVCLAFVILNTAKFQNIWPSPRQTQVIEGKPKHDGGKDRRTRVKHNAKLVN